MPLRFLSPSPPPSKVLQIRRKRRNSSNQPDEGNVASTRTTTHNYGMSAGYGKKGYRDSHAFASERTARWSSGLACNYPGSGRNTWHGHASSARPPGPRLVEPEINVPRKGPSLLLQSTMMTASMAERPSRPTPPEPLPGQTDAASPTTKVFTSPDWRALISASIVYRTERSLSSSPMSTFPIHSASPETSPCRSETSAPQCGITSPMQRACAPRTEKLLRIHD